MPDDPMPILTPSSPTRTVYTELHIGISGDEQKVRDIARRISEGVRMYVANGDLRAVSFHGRPFDRVPAWVIPEGDVDD